MSTWEIVIGTIAAEFSDLSDVEDATRITLRLFLAGLLGAALGYERESQGKAAGLRTHMLVALGSALFVIAPGLAWSMDDAMSRVIQGIITGIGFICAGTIIKGNDTGDVRGLTTAAGLWLTAAMGVAVGLGNEATAVLSTLIALFVLHVLPWMVRKRRKA
ncbi:MgtC/SapB family protein [Pseudazoarcus pumilus]|uniref:Protein MgtC n=1 Tax=Pseudazoarcus pumilus TaxID=2067960 RepID=A0A2I6S9S1_9RHOO|nr:MgtC/SapB family protein [Pseudazoarcus pumilus]AUN96008.1 methyltransferase [Pseudazoarcus pumilus]